MDAAIALALAGYVVLCAVPTGTALLRLLGVHDAAAPGERLTVAAALGLGAHAFALTLLGVAGFFFPMVVLALPLALAVASVPLGGAVLARLARAPRLSPWEWTATGLLSLLGLAVVVSDLAPPSDYDGLLYHLVAPRTYLTHGALVYIPHNFSANLPALGEMLFAVGLAAGSDRAPQLIHAAAGALSVGVAYVTARRALSGRGPFWAAAGFAATPLVPFLMTRAYIDLFTVLFTGLALWALVTWLEDRRSGALALCGVALGLAVSTKYAALTVALGMGVVVLWVSVRHGGIAYATRSASLTAAYALLAWLPWLARQTVTLGNPVWPMYVGGRDWDATRVEQLTYFVSQYGTGAALKDWLLLPVNVFFESWRFGHVPWSFPPPLAIAAPLAVLDRRAAARSLLAVAAIATLLWVRGWQDLRFLLTIYPLLALLGVAGVSAVLPRRWAEPALGLVVCGLLAVTLAREGQRALSRLPVVVGREPADAFLRREVSNHAAVSFLNRTARADEAVLFLGAGPIWYCRMRCIPDPAHDNLLVFFLGGHPRAAADPDSALARLLAEGVRHVLLSKVDFWYLEHQDPEARLKRQLAEFYVFKARHLELAYEDEASEVYRVR